MLAMRWQAVLSLIALMGLTLAWTKEDHEIFDLVSALESAEGKGTTFYSLLEVAPSANLATINKAYRKKSLQMHPDKNPGVKDIQERFARLGVIAGILRSPESRERYNFFFKNGVPVWRGTGYYYSRFRPTLLHTILFLVFLSSLAHMLVMRMNYNRDAKRVAYFENTARALAGTAREPKTSAGQPVKRRRKVKVPMVEGNEGAGFLELVVEDGQVFFAGEDGDVPLSSAAARPSILRTWPVALTLSLLRKCTAVLPPSIQVKFPATLLPLDAAPDSAAELDSSAEEGPDDTPTPASRNSNNNVNRNKVSQLKRQERLSGKKVNGTAKENGSTATSPEESAANTELDSADEEDELTGPNAEDADKKAKKKGPGKAGAARRRKMGMKK